MTIDRRVLADPTALGAAAAALIADRMEAKAGRFLLGCPAGRSAAGTYAALAEQVGERGLDLSRLVIVMMDDYLVPDGGGGLRRESRTAAHSCERFGREHIVAALNRDLPVDRRIPDANLWLPDPADPAAYDRRLTDNGGVDVFLLASGASDGHVAFNPPGTDIDAVTRIVDLPDSTRRDNLATFTTFAGALGNVPKHGVTVGVGTIRAQSREVIMLVHGVGKRLAVSRLTGATGYDPAWPATIYTECARPHLFVDAAAVAAADLPTG